MLNAFRWCMICCRFLQPISVSYTYHHATNAFISHITDKADAIEVMLAAVSLVMIAYTASSTKAMLAAVSSVMIAYRADSIEAMLAAIPSRFSIEKSLSLDSSSSSRASSCLMAGAHPVPNIAAAVPSVRAVPSSSAASPQPAYGMAAIPSRRSRDVPGLQPEVVPLTNAPGALGGHVTEAMSTSNMPRLLIWATDTMFC